jgi:hypothetical protein
LTALRQDLLARRLNLSKAFFFFCQNESGSMMMPSSPALFSDSLVSLAEMETETLNVIELGIWSLCLNGIELGARA